MYLLKHFCYWLNACGYYRAGGSFKIYIGFQNFQNYFHFDFVINLLCLNAGNASSWWVMQAGVKVLSTTRFLNPTFPTFLTNQFCVLWLSLLIQFGMVGIPTKHCFLNKNLFNLFFTSLCYVFILSFFIAKLRTVRLEKSTKQAKY